MDQNSVGRGLRSKESKRSSGDVARFNAEFEEFQKSSNVTRTRLYLETLKEEVPQMAKIVQLMKTPRKFCPSSIEFENAGGLVR